MLDKCDENLPGDMEALKRLRPRALVRTSPGNFQMWLTLSGTRAVETVLQMTKDLTIALGGDRFSAKTTQQGRLPGSTNVKLGKGCVVILPLILITVEFKIH